jgi:uncharacterized cupin superfamily protein
MTPTIASLMKLAAALGKSVSYFIDESEPLRPVTHVHAGERQLLYTSKKGLTLESISGRYGPFFVAGAEARVEPYANSGPEPMMHPGEELVVMLEGCMRFEIGGEPYLLEPGDSLHFRTTLRHSWSNPADVPARAIWLAIRSS